MDVLKKAKVLSDAGRFDSCGPKQCEIKVKNNLSGLYYAPSENKDCVMLKTLMTNKCSFDCKYCPNSASSKSKKSVSLTSNELVRVFDESRKRLGVNSLFLSSGLSNSTDDVMEDVIDAAKKIRDTFKGYIHLKIMPGASFEFVKRAVEVANRVSVNIEAPNSSSLSNISDCKNFKVDILRRQAWIKRLGGNQSTQMILFNNTLDSDVLKMANWEYESMRLRRVYYSAFSAVKNTPFEREVNVGLNRQNLLYNADFLLREYNFKLKELLGIMDSGMLPNCDPKLVLAKNYFSGPLDLNEATRDDLIRVPGIGLRSALRILKMRNLGKISSLKEIRRLGVNINRAAPFLEINGKHQLTLNTFLEKF